MLLLQPDRIEDRDLEQPAGRPGDQTGGDGAVDALMSLMGWAARIGSSQPRTCRR